jgi:hypothetical protein
MDMDCQEILKMQAFTSRPGILWQVTAISGMPLHNRKMFIAIKEAVVMRGLVQN